MKRWINRLFLEQTLARSEEVLNLLGYIPMVCIIPATVRAVGGKCQMLVGLSLGTVFYIRSRFSPSKKAIFLQSCILSFSHVIHGALNLLRGIIEACLCLGLLLCLPYDRLLRIRFRYPCEYACFSKAKKTEEDVIDIN